MSKLKVPERLQEIGAEFDLKVEEEAATPEEFTEVVDWIRSAIEERRGEMNDELDDFQNEVDGIMSDVLEDANDA
jgi:malate synthase